MNTSLPFHCLPAKPCTPDRTILQRRNSLQFTDCILIHLRPRPLSPQLLQILIPSLPNHARVSIHKVDPATLNAIASFLDQCSLCILTGLQPSVTSICRRKEHPLACFRRTIPDQLNDTFHNPVPEECQKESSLNLKPRV